MKPAPPVLDYVTNDQEVRLAVLADLHYGAPQCKKRAIQKFVDKIEAEKIHWISAGDLMENALINSLGDVYRQEIPPGSQLDDLCEILRPIAPLCLGMIEGNHGYRTAKQTDISPDRILAALLGIEDKFFGISIQGRIAIHHKGGSTNWTLAVHHTAGGGRTRGGKINALSRMADIWPMMDLYIGAHTHFDCYFSDRVKLIETQSGRVSVKFQTRHFTGASSTLDYDGSYAERKLMPPASLGQVILTLHRREHRHKIGPDAMTQALDREVVRI